MGELLTGQEANEEFGDKYYAELDFIETVEKAKEGYESDATDNSDPSLNGIHSVIMNPIMSNHLIHIIYFEEDEENSFRQSKSTTHFCKAEESNSAKMSLCPSAIKHTKSTNGEKLLSTRALLGPDEKGYVMDAKYIGNIGRYLNVTVFNFPK